MKHFKLRCPALAPLLFLCSLICFTACSLVNNSSVIEPVPETKQVTREEEKQDPTVAIIKVPPAILIHDVSGSSADSVAGYLAGIETELKLREGHHQIALRYSENWDIGGGDYEKVQSKREDLQVELVGGNIYNLGVDKLTTIREAQAFAQQPRFWLQKEGSSEKVYLK